MASNLESNGNLGSVGALLLAISPLFPLLLVMVSSPLSIPSSLEFLMFVLISVSVLASVVGITFVTLSLKGFAVSLKDNRISKYVVYGFCCCIVVFSVFSMLLQFFSLTFLRFLLCPTIYL